MPQFTVQDDTGRTLVLEGDSPPTEAELEELFRSPSKPEAAIPQPEFRLPSQTPVPGLSPWGQTADPAAGLREMVGEAKTPAEASLNVIKGLGRMGIGMATTLPMIPGKLAYEGAADIVAAGQNIAHELGTEDIPKAEYGGNLLYGPPTKTGEVPVDTFIRTLARTNPNLAPIGHLSKMLPEMSGWGAVGLLPAGYQRLIAAGFTLDMISHAPGQAAELGEELGKPKAEQDPEKIAQLEASLVAAPIFIQQAGKHALTKGKGYASSKSKTTEVHGDVRPQPGEGEQTLPAEEGGGRVQPSGTGPQAEQPQGEAREVSLSESQDRRGRSEWDILSPEERTAFAGEDKRWWSLNPEQKIAFARKSGILAPDEAPGGTVEPLEQINAKIQRLHGKQRDMGFLADVEKEQLASLRQERDRQEAHQFDNPTDKAMLDMERESLDVPVEIKDIEKHGDDPFAGGFMRARRGKGVIEIAPKQFSEWLNKDLAGLSTAQKQLAIRSRLAEERIHLAVDAAAARTFWSNLTGLEKRIFERIYIGPGERPAHINDQMMGDEALRYRIQKLAGMTPSELVETAGREGWTLKSLAVIESAIRGARAALPTYEAGEVKIGTRARRAQALLEQKYLERVEGNIQFVRATMMGQDPLARRRNQDELIAELEKKAQGGSDFAYDLHKLLIAKGGDDMKGVSVHDAYDATTTTEGQQLLRDILGDEAEKFIEQGQKHEQLLQQLHGLKYEKYLDDQEHGDEQSFPEARRRKGWQNPEGLTQEEINVQTELGMLKQPPQGYKARQEAERAKYEEMMWAAKHGKELKGEAPINKLPEVPESQRQIPREHQFRYEEATPDKLAELSKSELEKQRPSYEDLIEATKTQFGGVEPGALREAWMAQMASLVDAPGKRLAELVNQFRLRPKVIGPERVGKAFETGLAEEISGESQKMPSRTRGEMVIPDAETLDNPLSKSQKALRNRALAALWEHMHGMAEKQRKNVRREVVAPDELRWSVGPDAYEKVPEKLTGGELGDFLVREAGTDRTTKDVIAGGRTLQRHAALPESATRRLTVLQDTKTGRIHLVSTYRHGRQGPVIIDPNALKDRHIPVENLPTRFRPVFTMLLDEPVTAFHKVFKNIADYNDKFGSEAANRAQQAAHGAYGGVLPVQEEPIEGTPGLSGRPEYQSRAGALGSNVRLTVPEGKALYSYFGELDHLDEVATKFDELAERGRSRTLTPKDRMVVSALRKLHDAVAEQHPNLGEAGQLNRTIYEVAKQSLWSTTRERFLTGLAEITSGERPVSAFAEQPPAPEAAKTGSGAEVARRILELETRGERGFRQRVLGIVGGRVREIEAAGPREELGKREEPKQTAYERGQVYKAVREETAARKAEGKQYSSPAGIPWENIEVPPGVKIRAKGDLPGSAPTPEETAAYKQWQERTESRKEVAKATALAERYALADELNELQKSGKAEGEQADWIKRRIENIDKRYPTERNFPKESENDPYASRRNLSPKDEIAFASEVFKAWAARRPVKRNMAAYRDVADNQANIKGDQAGRAVQLKSAGKDNPEGKKEVLAAANAMLATGALEPHYQFTEDALAALKNRTEEHPQWRDAKNMQAHSDRRIRLKGVALQKKITSDVTNELLNEGVVDHTNVIYEFNPGAVAKLDAFEAKVEGAITHANNMLQHPNATWRGRERELKAKLAAANELKREIQYARDHWLDEDLQRTVIQAKKEFGNQFDREIQYGFQLKHADDYEPGRYDAEFASDKSVIFGPKNQLLGTRTRLPATFENYYDAIADKENAYVPATRDISALVAHRVRGGMRQLNRKIWTSNWKNVVDPVTNKPLAINTVTKDGVAYSPDKEYVIPRIGAGGYPIAVRRSFLKLYNQLTMPSVIHDYAPAAYILAVGQSLKHAILSGDFFHLGKITQFGLSILGFKNFGYKRGLNALELRPENLKEAVDKGVITQAEADWVNQEVPVNIGGRLVMKPRHAIASTFVNAGLNVGRISDAIYKDLIKQVPWVGRYNRFLFDKMTRGLMMQSALMEFERQHAANPNTNYLDVVKDISRDLNNYFGSIGRQGWIKSATFQDIARIGLLAPQWLEGLVMKEAMTYGRALRAPLRLLGMEKLAGRQGLTAMGTTGYGIGRGMASMLVLTQLINMITRRQPTWKNEEEGHKWDAWIPDVSGKSEGFWFSPLAVFNELMHDVVRLGHTKPGLLDAVGQIGQNKLHPFVPVPFILATGWTPWGERRTTAWSRAKAAAMQVAPVPITVSKSLQAVGHAVAPGMVSAPPAGAIQRQIIGSAGIKIEPADRPDIRMIRLAQEFAEKHGKSRSGWADIPTDEASYAKLRTALRNEDWKSAAQIFRGLQETRPNDSTILEGMKNWSERPFTGNHNLEQEFILSIADDPRKLEAYRRAQLARWQEYQKFLDWYIKTPDLLPAH